MFFNRVLVAIVAVALLLAHQSKCMSQEKEEPHYRCDTPGVPLEGMLTKRTFYGPPGSGETPAKDARARVLILKLAKPISVDPIGDAKVNHRSCYGAFPNVRQIQLWILPPNKAKALRARKLVGKTVVVVGTLEEGDAPSEHTEVVMEVKTIDSK